MKFARTVCGDIQAEEMAFVCSSADMSERQGFGSERL